MGLFDFFSGKKENTPANGNDHQLLEKVEIVPGLSIPRAFALHWAEIEKTRFPFLAITASPGKDLALEQSKFGHYPCLPAGFDYPTDALGRYMYPLAQLNCRDCRGLPGYPDSGYLQFYIAAFDDVYGIDFNDPCSQKNFRVLYFEETEVENYMADFSFLDEAMVSENLPVYQPHELQFSPKDDYVGLGDVRYERQKKFSLDAIAHQYPSIESALEDESYECFRSNGHKMGGYAFFTQTDPRSYKKEFKDHVLLLQIDSDDEIMWGDSGVANFFIHPDDLAKKDFSKVMYNWDCC